MPKKGKGKAKNTLNKAKHTKLMKQKISKITEQKKQQKLRLKEIIKNTIDFDFPLIDIENNIQTLELFHGPTLAFKDVGARFMANCLADFNKSNSDITTVLVATSGDTGAAVANGFLDVKGTNVVILYPKNMVSEIQEKQLTTNKKNITAFRVNGTFDDCQQMVKKAFTDKELNNESTNYALAIYILFIFNLCPSA